jgi:hypothetical protein
MAPEGRMQLFVLSIVLAASALAADAPSSPAGGRIVGEWRGSSICTNRKILPACKDESIRYVFTGPAEGTNTYHLIADKLVSGSYQTMGEMDLVYSAVENTWTNDANAPACKNCQWWYRIEKSGLVGGLKSGTGEPLRKVAAKRHEP